MKEMDAKQAGSFLRERRRKLGLTQEAVVEVLGTTSAQYISALESGRYDVRNSQHLPKLAALYNLTPDELKALNPNLVIQIQGPTLQVRKKLPASLLHAIEKFGDNFPDLKTNKWQQYLATTRFRQTPVAPEEWLETYLVLSRLVVPPDLLEYVPDEPQN